MAGALFISYSHTDRRWMNLVRTHLEGALRGRDITVWTDRSIRPGTPWQAVLEGAAGSARHGLVLASPEYLVSEWCRRELADLAARHRDGKIDGVYWLLLRPCAWSWTELATLQAVQEPATVAIETLPAGPERDQFVLDLCAKVARDLITQADRVDPNLAMVSALLERAGHQKDYRVTRELGKGRSEFAMVFRALDQKDNDRVLKVLTNTPLHSLRELFHEVAGARQHLNDPSFVKIDDVFVAGGDRDGRIVIVTELAPDVTLDQVIEKDGPMTPERTGRILSRLAVALAKLHALPPVPHSEPYRHVMGPLIPDALYWDERAQMPLMSLAGVTAFLWHFFDPHTFRRIVRPTAGEYVAPDKLRAEPVTPLVDQYFLGMLALQLLEGELLFRGAQPRRPLDVIAATTRPWGRNRQFVGLLQRLLADEPAHRFPSMQHVVEHLAAMEEPHRVLAKWSYEQWIRQDDDGSAFAAAFYERFFARDPQARALFGRLPDAEHHRKLVLSLVAVLNHRRGNAPTSIQPLVARHRDLQIGAAQLVSFRDAFIETLDHRLGAAERERDAVLAAWRQLFEPVLEELADALGVAGWASVSPGR